jgi:tRNA pseudouridine38-40 synthase
MPHYKAIISYIGSSYLGWQKNNAGPSIEESLEKALAQIGGGKTPLIQAASRTDAGVHAHGQVIDFLMGQPVRLHNINAVLPQDISMLELEEVSPTFHATLDCTSKEYHYHLCNDAAQLPFYRHTSWHVPSSLCESAMKKAAAHLIGVHDFSAFCNERSKWEKDTVREIFQIEIIPLGHRRLNITVRGNRFLYKMVRNIVGTLVDVGSGKRSADALPEILQAKSRSLAGVTAPAHGLALHRVFYAPHLTPSLLQSNL